MKKELYCENVGEIAADAIDLIEDKLKEFNINLSIEDSDKIYDAIISVLDELTVGDYRNFN